MRTSVVRVFGIVCLVLMNALPCAAQPSPWLPGRPERVVASSGLFEPHHEASSSEIGAELQLAPRRFGFEPDFLPEVIPVAGVMAGAQGSLYAYAGFRWEFPFGQRWMFSPAWAGGLYKRSDDFDLGGPVEFRSSLELAYRLPDGARLGICLYHLSNAGLFTRNPGSESLVVTYSAGLWR